MDPAVTLLPSDATTSLFSWFVSPEMRTILIVLVFIAVAGLILRVIQLGQRQARNIATVSALVDGFAEMQAVIMSQRDTIEKGVQALVELNGHVAVSLDRTRLSPSTRELLNRLPAEREDHDPRVISS